MVVTNIDVQQSTSLQLRASGKRLHQNVKGWPNTRDGQKQHCIVIIYHWLTYVFLTLFLFVVSDDYSRFSMRVRLVGGGFTISWFIQKFKISLISSGQIELQCTSQFLAQLSLNGNPASHQDQPIPQ